MTSAFIKQIVAHPNALPLAVRQGEGKGGGRNVRA